MQKQSEIIRSSSEAGLTTLSTNVILREQSKTDVLKHICYLLGRIGMLYQIPNWSAENSVVLAEWIYDNYNTEDLKTVTDALTNPPQSQETTTWRLTPETITKWMAPALERAAMQREKAVTVYKDKFKEPLPGVDYEAFKKRVEVEGLPDPPKQKGWGDPAYIEYRNEYERKRMVEHLEKLKKEKE